MLRNPANGTTIYLCSRFCADIQAIRQLDDVHSTTSQIISSMIAMTRNGKTAWPATSPLHRSLTPATALILWAIQAAANDDV